MKRAMAVLLVLALVGGAGFAEEKKAAGSAGSKDEGKKITLANFSKGDMFEQTSGPCEISLTEEHLTGKEKTRCKTKGEGWAFNLKRNLDWSASNYLVFNCFLAGDKPWTGMILLGDKSSSEKWTQNYVEIPLTLKPGENKEVHVAIEGLFVAYANRPLEMKDIRIICFYAPGNGNRELFFGNLYLVHEED